jgi:ubiquitin C-terminal hydrolase
VDARARQFQGNAQQDAHEFICVLLQALQEEVVAAEAPAAAGAPAAPAAGARRAATLETTADPAARNFGGTLEREMVCKACLHRASKREPFMHLSLDVPPRPGRPSVGLPEMLSSFFAEEELEKACEGCGAERAAHAVRLRIARMPRVLMLHLKRFQMGPRGQPLKVSTPVDLSHVLNVAPFCAPGAFLPPPLAPADLRGDVEAAAPGGAGGSNSLMQRFSLAGLKTPAKSGETPAVPAAEQTPRPTTPFPTGEGAPGPVELVDGGSGARAPDGAPSAHRYRLHGLVSHLGAGDVAGAGHFITDTADPASGRWTRHDDSRVYQVEPRSLQDRTSDCYVLEYVHDAAWRP